MIELEVHFKQGLDTREWDVLHPQVYEVFELLSLILVRMGYYVEITSLLRKKTSDSGVHETGRALDCVPRVTKDTRARAAHERDMQIVANLMNLVYRRNDQKKTVIYHDSGTGKHFHIQVPQTKGWVDLKGYLPQRSSSQVMP
jgi:hypothetical protein